MTTFMCVLLCVCICRQTHSLGRLWCGGRGLVAAVVVKEQCVVCVVVVCLCYLCVGPPPGWHGASWGALLNKVKSTEIDESIFLSQKKTINYECPINERSEVAWKSDFLSHQYNIWHLVSEKQPHCECWVVLLKIFQHFHLVVIIIFIQNETQSEQQTAEQRTAAELHQL